MASDTRIRNQWNAATESWVEFVRSGKDYYREYLNGPALKRMIGEVKGKRVLDVGCGEGYFSRFFAKMGAEVTGIDFSEDMIRAAVGEEERHPLDVRYHVADAANLYMLRTETYDVAFCFMALMDISDHEGAISEVSQLLKIGGKFIVLIPHPCFTAPRVVDGEIVTGWESRIREDGSKEYLYNRVDDYFHRQSFKIKWNSDRLPSSFVTTSFHRTLSDYFNALVKQRFAITGLDEPQPIKEGVIIHPPLKKHYRVPQSIVIEATKIRDNKQ